MKSLNTSTHHLLTACAECPVGTEPVVGFEYKWWNRMPSNMRSSVYRREYSESGRSTGRETSLLDTTVGCYSREAIAAIECNQPYFMNDTICVHSWYMIMSLVCYLL